MDSQKTFFHLHKGTQKHCQRVSDLSVSFGNYLKFTPTQLIELSIGGLFHDIGKFYLPEYLLQKDKLSTSEFNTLKTHPSVANNLYSINNGTSNNIIDIITQHHEKENGTGYPLGLNADEINPLSKIVSICDVFDALTEERSYKSAFSLTKALSILDEEASKGLLNKELITLFTKFITERPNLEKEASSLCLQNEQHQIIVCMNNN